MLDILRWDPLIFPGRSLEAKLLLFWGQLLSDENPRMCGFFETYYLLLFSYGLTNVHRGLCPFELGHEQILRLRKQTASERWNNLHLQWLLQPDFFLLFITLDQVALQFYSCCPRPVQEQKGLRQPKQGSTAAFCGGLEDWLSCHGWSDLSSGCKTPLFFLSLYHTYLHYDTILSILGILWEWNDVAAVGHAAHDDHRHNTTQETCLISTNSRRRLRRRNPRRFWWLFGRHPRIPSSIPSGYD